MKILCAVDFSEGSLAAARSAARLCGALDGELHLVHAAHLPGVSRGTSATPFGMAKEELDRRAALLDDLAATLRGLVDPKRKLRVTTALRDGLADEIALAVAAETRADLIVVGALGERAARDAGLGGVAARVIKGSGVPVLVVRDEMSLERWLAGKAPLRAMIGIDPHAQEHPSLAWMAQWKVAGAIEPIGAHVYAPGPERQREVSEMHERELSREVVAALVPTEGGKEPRVRVLGGFGRVSEHLLDLANTESADLVVIGTHRRHGWNRWLHGSVSLDIVGVARRNCLTVPLVGAPRATREPGLIRRITVPVDFSEHSSHALAWAVQMLPRGGVLHVVHVVVPYIAAGAEYGMLTAVPTADELAAGRADVERRLRELVPASASERGLEVHVEQLDGFDPAGRILAAARESESDVICMPTHGRGLFSRALLGSVTHAVVQRSTLPVLVLPIGKGRA